MILCELCVLQQADGRCAYGRPTPKKMRCVDFAPGVERFCSIPADYTGREQLKQMALFFGLAGKELKRVLALSEARNDDSPTEQTCPRLQRSSETGLP